MRVLIVTSQYPPFPGPRSIQIGRLANALNAAGCSVHVLAGQIAGSAHPAYRDEDTVAVTRVPHRMYWGSTGIKRLANRASREINSVSTVFGWAKSAIKETASLLPSFAPDIMLSSSSPFESHLVALAINARYKIPWVASFSDPWPPHILPDPYRTKKIFILGNIQMMMIRRVLRQCDRIHMMTSNGISYMENATGLPLKAKAFNIPQSGQKALIPPLSSSDNWLVHLGALTRERISEPLVRGIIKARKELKDGFRGLRCVGWVCPEFKNLIKRLNADDAIHCMGEVSPEEAVRQSIAAHALLVIEADMPTSPFLPSKFADYAVSQRPILAVTPLNSAIRNYVNEYGGALLCHHDFEEISHAIRSIFGADSALSPTVGTTLAQQFSVESVVEKYIHLFQCTIKICKDNQSATT